MHSILNRAIAAVAACMTLAAAPGTTPRPAADVARDADRKPAEMVKFAGIKPGMTVVDVIPGGGYFTRVFSAAVGAKGTVIALVPSAQAARSPEAVTSLKALAAEPGLGNVNVVVSSFAPLATPATIDVIWTAQNYHDLHNPALPAATVPGINKAIFAALKPGGTYIVVDHAAASGSALRDVNTLHRIDPETVKAEVVAAGFRFESASPAIANPADDHSKAVFDPAIRGHTDQFVYRFRKPR